MRASDVLLVFWVLPAPTGCLYPPCTSGCSVCVDSFTVRFWQCLCAAPRSRRVCLVLAVMPVASLVPTPMCSEGREGPERSGEPACPQGRRGLPHLAQGSSDGC